MHPPTIPCLLAKKHQARNSRSIIWFTAMKSMGQNSLVKERHLTQQVHRLKLWQLFINTVHHLSIGYQEVLQPSPRALLAHLGIPHMLLAWEISHEDCHDQKNFHLKLHSVVISGSLLAHGRSDTCLLIVLQHWWDCVLSHGEFPSLRHGPLLQGCRLNPLCPYRVLMFHTDSPVTPSPKHHPTDGSSLAQWPCARLNFVHKDDACIWQLRWLFSSLTSQSPFAFQTNVSWIFQYCGCSYIYHI